MKIRAGFISNSSSSCFIISKNDLTQKMINKINDHINYAAENFPDISYAYENQRWDVNEYEDKIAVYTWMNNFDMHQFLLNIGVGEDDIKSGDISDVIDEYDFYHKNE